MPRSPLKTTAADNGASRDFRRLLVSARWALDVTRSAHPQLLLGLVIVTVARGLLPAGAALVVRGLINTAVERADAATSVMAPLLPWLLLGLGLTFAEAVSRFAHRFLIRRLNDDLHLGLTTRILEHASRLDVPSFEDPEFQDVAHRARSDAAGHFSRLLTDTLTLATQLTQAGSLVAVLAMIEPLALPLLLPLAVPHFLYQWRVSRQGYRDEYGRATKRRWSAYFVSLLTSRQSVPEVKLLGLAPVLIERFRRLSAEFRDQNRKRYLQAFVGDSLFAALTTTAFYALLARVVMQFVGGAIFVGDLVVFGTVGLRLRGALEGLVTTASHALGSAPYISNLREFLAVKPSAATRGKRVPAAGRGAIEFRGVGFSYPGTTRPVLSDVSLHVKPGETVALVGRNGAGKTTLVKLVAGFYEPTSGSVLYDGVDLRELSPEYLRRQIGFVFQNFRPFEATAAENIAYGDYSRLFDDRDGVDRVARRAKVNEMIERLPQGYDTLLGRQFGEHDLSRGQWQRMALARAAARDATLLILDEPTSNMDAAAEHRLFRRFRDLSRGKTTILVSHRFSTLRLADRIVVLDRGRIVETGTHDELLSRQGHYATLYAFQRERMPASANATAAEWSNPASRPLSE